LGVPGTLPARQQLPDLPPAKQRRLAMRQQQVTQPLPDSPLRDALSRLVERAARSNGDDHALQNDERKDDQGEQY